MKVEKIGLDQTGYFSKTFLDYLSGADELRPFYQSSPSIDSFGEAIASRNFPSSHRKTLVSVLQKQYDGLEISDPVKDNLQRLGNENCFTVTTGHQLNIFTGPLYFIYKIVSVVNACRELKSKHPDKDFVPVYWMASEDHDFEEISYFNLFGKKYQWKTEQSGAVGRFDPSELKDLIDSLPGDVSVFEKAYLGNETLASAAREYVNALFGEYGVVVVDADDVDLKVEFTEVIKADVLNQSIKPKVDVRSAELDALGHKVQVHCRDINFFYLEGSVRGRLEKVGDHFEVVDFDRKFSKEEITKLIDEHPERFSPNVILRPLYQETILPNLSYVGGPSELVYWLQLKPVFGEFEKAFPILMPRNFGLVFPKHHQRTWDKTGLGLIALFRDVIALEKQWVETNSQNDLSFQGEIEEVEKTFTSLKEKAESVDPTLIQHLEALKSQAEKRIAIAEKKLVRAEKRNHSDALGQINAVKEALFPKGSLQERHDNFLNFYQQDSDFIQKLVDGFDPFDFSMHVFLDE